MLSDQKPREIAAHVLRQQFREPADFVENLLEKEFARSHLSTVDRGLCQELVYGVVRWRSTLDSLIARKTDGRAQPSGLQTLLRLGLYQIFWLDRIPDHAAVNETVELAKRGGFGKQAGFVNAVLRGYLRDFDGTKKWLADLQATDPSLGHSHPEWLIARWQKRWGPMETAQLLEWNNRPPKIFARVNHLKPAGLTDEQRTTALIEQWRAETVEYDFVRRDWIEENLVFELKSHPTLAQLPSFQEGRFYIQDPSTLLAVRELDPQPGDAVLDLCAAPGGKTTYIAQRMQNRGHIVAQDLSPDRLRLVEQNCARLGADIVSFELAETAPAARDSQFDRILIDAPCSNTGVMRRRVDLRWRLRVEEIDRLRSMQLDLLRRAAPWLRPGGVLVYSTCSLEPEENESVVEQFLEEHSAYRRERRRELTPFRDGVDGAFVARLERKA